MTEPLTPQCEVEFGRPKGRPFFLSSDDVSWDDSARPDVHSLQTYSWVDDQRIIPAI